MRRPAFLAAFLLVLAAAPAFSQVALPPSPTARNGDRLLPDDTMRDRDELETARDLMARTLPFKHGQTLRYYNGDGELVGTARRNRLTIRFYDPDGALIGRAERVSQAATNYYGPDGRYLGRRLHKKQTTRSHVTYDQPDSLDSSAKGFREATKPMGQPGEED